jgi:hypothetical protein
MVVAVVFAPLFFWALESLSQRVARKRTSAPPAISAAPAPDGH